MVIEKKAFKKDSNLWDFVIKIKSMTACIFTTLESVIVVLILCDFIMVMAHNIAMKWHK